MRKVTASAVILTALTGCGQNSGIPSTQWSFEIPAEDEISSLALDQDVASTSETTLVANSSASTISGRVDAFVEGAFGASTGDLMGPAFEQPSAVIDASATDASVTESARSSSPVSKSYRITSSADTERGYQPVAARPDPVAQVKAFLSAHGSPSALTGLEPYQSSVVTSALPAVYLPLPPTPVDFTATLSNPADINARASAVTGAGFTSAGLPIVESSAGGVYSTDHSTATGSLAATSVQERPIYQPVDYSNSTELAAVPSNVAPSSLNVSGNVDSIDRPLAIGEDGLPRLEPSSAKGGSIGTAILQNLQADEIAQTASAEPVQDLSAQVVAGDRVETVGISIDIVPSEADELSRDLAVETAPQVSAYGTAETAATLEDLQRSVLVRDVSPLVTYASQAGAADLAVEAIAISTPQPTFPTLESLLETMPETAAQPNLAVELSGNDSAASPLLEGITNTNPLSTIYRPIPEAALEDGVDASASANASLVRESLSSLSERVAVAKTHRDSFAETLGSRASKVANLRRGRNKAILSLVDKPVAKQRQLVTY